MCEGAAVAVPSPFGSDAGDRQPRGSASVWDGGCLPGFFHLTPFRGSRSEKGHGQPGMGKLRGSLPSTALSCLWCCPITTALLSFPLATVAAPSLPPHMHFLRNLCLDPAPINKLIKAALHGAHASSAEPIPQNSLPGTEAAGTARHGGFPAALALLPDEPPESHQKFPRDGSRRKLVSGAMSQWERPGRGQSCGRQPPTGAPSAQLEGLLGLLHSVWGTGPHLLLPSLAPRPHSPPSPISASTALCSWAVALPSGCCRQQDTVVCPDRVPRLFELELLHVVETRDGNNKRKAKGSATVPGRSESRLTL